MKIEKITESITRCVIPYADIYTTVYAVALDEGYLLFDTASGAIDVDMYILPFLHSIDVTPENLKLIFISHNHKDHAHGLARLLALYPNATVVARDEELKEEHPHARFLFPEDMEVLSPHLLAVTVPGHTPDCMALYDKRTKTLLSGDALQLYGIFGSGEWGANITLPRAHFSAVEKLRGMDVEAIYTAHDYHPYGYAYIGCEAVENALDAATRPLLTIKRMMENRPHLSNAEIRRLYEASAKLPTVADKVFAAVRDELVSPEK